jgi:hypothetical protein
LLEHQNNLQYACGDLPLQDAYLGPCHGLQARGQSLERRLVKDGFAIQGASQNDEVCIEFPSCGDKLCSQLASTDHDLGFKPLLSGSFLGYGQLELAHSDQARFDIHYKWGSDLVKKADVRYEQKDEFVALLLGQGNGRILGPIAGLTPSRSAQNLAHRVPPQ